MRSRIAGLVTVFAALSGCSSAPERAPSLDNMSSFPNEFRLGAQTVAASILIQGEVPSEFRAIVEGPQNGILTFHLWHKSAFTPENRNTNGNPGGKCRDVKFEIATNKVISTVFWQ